MLSFKQYITEAERFLRTAIFHPPTKTMHVGDQGEPHILVAKKALGMSELDKANYKEGFMNREGQFLNRHGTRDYAENNSMKVDAGEWGEHLKRAGMDTSFLQPKKFKPMSRKIEEQYITESVGEPMIYYNTTVNQLQAIAKNSKYNMARFIITHDNKMHGGDANHYEHMDLNDHEEDPHTYGFVGFNHNKGKYIYSAAKDRYGTESDHPLLSSKGFQKMERIPRLKVII